MISRATNLTPAPAVVPAIRWLTIGVIGAAFLAAEHTWLMSRLDMFSVTSDEMAISAAVGSWLRRLAFMSIAIFGIYCIFRSSGKRLRFDGLLAFLVLSYLAWCLASVLWSTEPPITIRRLAALVFCCLGALGISRQLGARDLCVLGMFIATAYIILGVCAEISLGTFQPFSSEYRFSGTVHPNTQGTYCALLCMGAACLASRSTHPKRLMIFLFLVGVTFLLLTRSRTSCGALVIALGVLWSMTLARRVKLLAAVAIGSAISIGGVVMLLAGMNVEEKLSGTLLLGRQEDARSLSGRVPLWTELTASIEERPLLGYGYGGFWTSERVGDISATLKFPVAEAHSVYLDTVLSIGLVGAVVFFGAVAVAVGRAAWRCRKNDEAAAGFILVLLIFSVASGSLESVALTMFVTFVAACGLCRLAFVEREDETSHE